MTDVAIPPATASDISAKVMSQCFEKWQTDVCSWTTIFTAYNDVGVVIACNFMGHKDGVILMSSEIRRGYDNLQAKSILKSGREEDGGTWEEEEEDETKKKKKGRRRGKIVVVIIFIAVVGDVSPFTLVKDVSRLVVCFYTVFELPVFLSCSLYPERMLIKELLL